MTERPRHFVLVSCDMCMCGKQKEAGSPVSLRPSHHCPGEGNSPTVQPGPEPPERQELGTRVPWNPNVITKSIYPLHVPLQMTWMDSSVSSLRTSSVGPAVGTAPRKCPRLEQVASRHPREPLLVSGSQRERKPSMMGQRTKPRTVVAPLDAFPGTPSSLRFCTAVTLGLPLAF